MKASMIIASTVALFFSGALAAPTVPAHLPSDYFTFSLINDQTGASEIRTVIRGESPVTLAELFKNTRLVQGGHVIATSAQALAPSGRAIKCVFTNLPAGKVFRLNDQEPFADLDGNDKAAVPTDVTDFTFECE
ncbi:uncharacterized protein K460DRAFT_353919 [Cucurbitaria berberidis CBS 394.84]|uniref:Ubiquitin 3 binding protein But2 C-terminal domain-containing protein n=1 Tax=Cucurbitaria berberidis CBS 394.84 TaxID=1168544 RepID=A0A9P4LB00_9PLEO|nr:uncharacterized protein K460DRAFT_353919 [Cucurbitaria berberidis CBS 394.84]KAF1849006.1 hypothetical protein K460DRAFT_353919 [Cucurbitaria berberidis CBS 394.84]